MREGGDQAPFYQSTLFHSGMMNTDEARFIANRPVLLQGDDTDNLIE